MKTFKKVVRVIAYVLLLCFMVTELSGVAEVIAAERKINNSVQQESTVENKGNKKNKEKFEDDDVIFKHLDKENFKNGKHISRLEHEEKLNTYVFGNEDGSKTVYYMYENVKYKDKDGKIKDKDISLVKKNKGYGIVQNEVDLFLPENPSDGVTVNYSGYDVTIIPQGGNGKVKAKQCDDAIIYDEYFGKNASLKYTPLLSGVKEDIILKSYVENATYDFMVETNGLYIYNDDIGYYLADETNSTIFYYLGDVEVYDAVGKPELGEMKVTILEEGQRYKLTLSVSDTFLSDPETVYPVTIDPTITISDTATGADSIIDAPIFKLKETKNYAKYKYNTVGTTTESYGVGRTVVKLPGLTSSNEYQTITADQIASVKFYVRDSSGTGKQTIYLYPLSNTTWTETSVTWSNVGTYYSIQYSATLSSGKVSAFDITTLVKDWKNNKLPQDSGFILINSTETKNKSFCSSEYGTTSYRPYVEMTYDSVFSISKSEADVVEGGTTTITAVTNPSGLAVAWKIADGSIATIISSSNTECEVRGGKAGKTTLTATMTDAAGVTQKRTCTIYVYITNGVYYIKNLNSGYYLHVDGGKINSRTSVLQCTKYSDFVAESSRLCQMWKIQYLDDGFYSIRPMHKLNMGLHGLGSNVDIWNIGTTDSLTGVENTAKWTIEYDSSGYVFKQNANKNYTMQLENASTSLFGNVVASEYSDVANCKWSLEKISAPPNGVLIYNTSTQGVITDNYTRAVAIGQTRNLSNMNLTAVVYAGTNINQTVYWTTSNPDKVKVNSSTGEVTGLSEGTATVIAYTYLNGNYRSDAYTLEVLPFENGTYFVKNRQYSKYLQIDNDDASNDYITSGAIMEQWAYDGGLYQKWKLVSLENGYYQIISYKSGLALSVPATQEDEEDIALIQRAYTGAYSQQWKITLTENGSYKIAPRSSDTFVMAVGDYIINNANGVHIEQREYVDNNSYKDEWYIGEKRIFNATVNIYYDMGYCVRYDETIEEAEESISKYMEAVAEIFEEQFGLQINYRVSFYNSPIDQCKGEVTQDNIDTLCEHTLDHTNKENMMHNFMKDYPGSSTVTTLYWTGHGLSLEDGMGDGNGSCSWYNSVFLLGTDTDENERNRKSYRGLLHELCHQYGVYDHYHTGENDIKDDKGNVIEIRPCENAKYECSYCADIKRNNDCVMGNATELNKNMLWICEDCAKEIMEHLEKHHE